MSEIVITFEQLRSMIGLTVRYYGRLYQIIEVLEDGPSLVLLAAESQRTIQPSLTGEATRRAPQTETVRVLSTDRSELHYDFLALELA
jgi:hypothetical protein